MYYNRSFFTKIRFQIFFVCLFMPICLYGSTQRILFVVGYFPVLSETFILNQITELIDRGHRVHIHSFHQTKAELMHSDIEKYQLLKRVSYGKNIPLLRNFDIVYVQFGFHAQSVVQAARQQKYQGGIVTCIRGSDISRELVMTPRVYEKIFDRVDMFLPVCDAFKEKLIKKGCDPSKICVHHSAVDCRRFKYREPLIKKGDQTIKIVTICRLIEKKGLEDALHAFAYLFQKYPMLRYTIIGEGPLKTTLLELIHQYCLEEVVTLYGQATQTEVIESLNQADIFLLPSCTASDGNQEGIPNALKEAMAVGVPVISTYHSGITELIEDKKSGLLVLEHDIAGIIQAVEYIMNSPDNAKEMVIKARHIIETEFDLQVMIEKLETIFSCLKVEKIRRIWVQDGE